MRICRGTLEGDPRFFFDDAEDPQAQGTGSEEWGGGGDCWGGQNMTLPLLAPELPLGSEALSEVRYDANSYLAVGQ